MGEPVEVLNYFGNAQLYNAINPFSDKEASNAKYQESGRNYS